MNGAAEALRVTTLERVFSDCFRDNAKTLLQGGYSEPLYQPAVSTDQLNVLRYREDFFASALHEAAHWCIAGPARRKQIDFGYWYAPDGRNASQQSAFENVEYKPQALEWFFAKACGYRFRISVDNLNPKGTQSLSDDGFEQRVIDQAKNWAEQGLPADGSNFFNALCRQFGTNDQLCELHFSLAELL
jgi:elongation factor P hydroxylase